MNVSIVIPTKDRKSILEETIQHIFNQSYPVEVILVNDGEQSLDYLSQKYQSICITKNRHKGAASARNTGAALAKNELLLFLDDDMLIDSNCLKRHADLHKQYPRSLVSGSWQYTPEMVEMLKKSPFGRYKLENDYQSLQGNEESKLAEGLYQAPSLASFNLSILRSDFEELNGFNESFPYAGCEDQEFTMRAKEKGLTLILDTTNITINNEKDRADMDRWLKRQYTGVQGYPLLCELFPYRKTETLYYENTPINNSDATALKRKKRAKAILSTPLIMSTLRLVTSILETLKWNDKLLFRLYKALCGLYIFKGFRTSYNALQNKKPG